MSDRYAHRETTPHPNNQRMAAPEQRRCPRDLSYDELPGDTGWRTVSATPTIIWMWGGEAELGAEAMPRPWTAYEDMGGSEFFPLPPGEKPGTTRRRFYEPWSKLWPIDGATCWTDRNEAIRVQVSGLIAQRAEMETRIAILLAALEPDAQEDTPPSA